MIFQEKLYEIFSLSQPPFSHFRRPQTEFHIGCTTFSPLQNGKKEIKKKVSHSHEIRLTMLNHDIVFIVKTHYRLINS